MKKVIQFISLTVLFSCSEPFDFEIESEIDVVDAKISTLEGSSYIDIYQVRNGTRFNLQDLTVRVISGSNDQIDFVFDDFSQVYVPQDVSFVGMVGERYRMEAVSTEGVIYQSSYDTIFSAGDFGIIETDTTLFELSDASNNLVPRNAKAAIAVLPFGQETSYLKFDFSYAYEDFWSGEIIEIDSGNELILYANTLTNNPQSDIQIPVGSEPIKSRWIFIDRSRPGSECPVDNECVASVDPCCGNPCCESFSFWFVDLIITQESMSFETYQFWENVEKLISNDGLVFDTYPFPINGNVTCENCENEMVGSFRTVSEIRRSVEVVL